MQIVRELFSLMTLGGFSDQTWGFVQAELGLLFGLDHRGEELATPGSAADVCTLQRSASGSCALRSQRRYATGHR